MSQLSDENYFVNVQRSVRKGDMEIIQRYSVFGLRVRNIDLIKKGLRFGTEYRKQNTGCAIVIIFNISISHYLPFYTLNRVLQNKK